MDKTIVDKGQEYMSVAALTIVPGTSGQFDLFLRRGSHFILYCNKGDVFSEERLTKVLEVTEFYIKAEQKREYEEYLAKNLGELLQNESVPIQERSKIFVNMSSTVLKKAFETKLPKGFSEKTHQAMADIVNASIRFFTKKEALRSFSQLISHTYHTYSHSIQVMVLTLSLLQRERHFDKNALRECGMGALLHDIGKTEIPSEVLNRNPKDMTAYEWDLIRTHPAKGMRICATLPLSQRTLNCIIFHHEKFDGMGYPGGLGGEDIPLEARVLSVCNIYDMLTTDKAYAKALSPYDALKVMRDEMQGAFDDKMYKRLVYVLSDARIT